MKVFENLLGKAERVVSTLSNIALALCAVVVVVMTFIITAYVTARGLGQSWVFVEEYSGYALVLIVYFGLAYTLRTGGHINVEIVVRFLRPRTRKVLEALTTLVALGVVCFMLERGIYWFLHAIRMGIHSDWPTESPMWIFHLFVPLGLGMFSLQILLHFIRTVMAAVVGVVEEEKKVPSISGE